MTADQYDFGGALYVEANRNKGQWGAIRVVTSDEYPRGETLDITGQAVLAPDGEVEISPTSVVPDTAGLVTPPTPLAMHNKTLGGGATNHYAPGINCATEQGTGFSNKGTLVKSWGKVTSVDGTDFYIDDGSALSDGSGNKGVRVSWQWSLGSKTPLAAPPLGSTVAVTGISSSDADSDGTYYRVLRPRNQSDITMFNDNTAVSITMPANGVLHKDANKTSVLLAGVATADTPITAISVKIDSGGWLPASFTSSDSTSWTYNWTGLPTSGGPWPHTIYVRATDSAGQSATATESVTLYSITPIYVSPTGNGTGLNAWQGAYTTVSAGVSAASSGRDVWVAANPNTYSDHVYPLKSGVGLYGGFSGTETAREQRNWVSNPTVMDGGGSGSGTPWPVIYMSGVTGCAIDGLTIQNGYVLADYYFSGGGGVCCLSAQLTMANDTITGNFTSGLGGGIYCDSGSTLSMSNCTIQDNSAPDGCGGALFADSCGVSITNSTISGNWASWIFGGDGIYCCDNSCLVVSGSTITANGCPSETSWYGGCGILCVGSSPTISNNVITNNLCHGIYCRACPTAAISGNAIAGNLAVDCYDVDDQDTDDCGGGIYCDGLTADNDAPGACFVPGCAVNISGNVIGGSAACLGNTANYEGGGIFCLGVTATINSNLIESNSCSLSSVTRGGGLSMWNCPGSVITNNLFAYNLTNGATTDLWGGGAIYVDQEPLYNTAAQAVAIVNNTFVCNSSAAGVPLTPKAYGGAIQIDWNTNPSTNAVVLNNIFYSNVAATGQGSSVAFTDSAAGAISCCDAYDQGSQSQAYDYYGIVPGSGCSYGNPALYLESLGNWNNPFWLQSGSAALETGTNPAQNPLVPSVDMGPAPAGFR